MEGRYCSLFGYSRNSVDLERIFRQDYLPISRKVDVYYNKWIKVTGRNGMMVYNHFLGSGNVVYYIFEYRNLYQYSQQGFEMLQGGHGSAEEDQSHILQVAHFNTNDDVEL